jgi:hypothetical protein
VGSCFTEAGFVVVLRPRPEPSSAQANKCCPRSKNIDRADPIGIVCVATSDTQELDFFELVFFGDVAAAGTSLHGLKVMDQLCK